MALSQGKQLNKKLWRTNCVRLKKKKTVEQKTPQLINPPKLISLLFLYSKFSLCFLVILSVLKRGEDGVCTKVDWWWCWIVLPCVFFFFSNRWRRKATSGVDRHQTSWPLMFRATRGSRYDSLSYRWHSPARLCAANALPLRWPNFKK